MARIRKASEIDKRRMKKEVERTGKKLAEERGKCLACVRYSENAQYVDLGGELPRIGHMYICSTCIDRCRRVLGYASQKEFDAQALQFEEVKAENKTLKKEVSELEKQLEAATNKVFTEVLLKGKEFGATN
jgi:hypothetical protein